MGIDLNDAKKFNSVRKRNLGEVYCVDEKGESEFRSIGLVVVKEYDSKKLHEALKGLDSADLRQEEKIQILKDTLIKLIDRVEKLEKAVEQYGMV